MNDHPFSHVRVGVAVLVRRRFDFGNEPDRNSSVWEVLFGLRKGSHAPGTWSFPGGNLERGEFVTECAARELAEETGLVFAPARFQKLPFYTQGVFADPNDARPDRHYVTLFATIDLNTNVEAKILEPEKCAEWRWVKRPTSMTSTGSERSLPRPLFGGLEELVSAFDLWWPSLPEWGAR